MGAGEATYVMALKFANMRVLAILHWFPLGWLCGLDWRLLAGRFRLLLRKCCVVGLHAVDVVIIRRLHPFFGLLPDGVLGIPL